MDQISIEALIKAGAHFGHPTSRWHPRFKNYISMKKNGVHIIDMEQTSRCMIQASKAIGEIVKDDGNILFVGTKKQAKDVVQQAADRCGMYYIVERWLGGTLTNYGTIKKSIKRLTSLEKESSAIYSNLTKKELNSLERERLRLADLHRGIKDMKHLPRALFFVDGIHERIAISEARILDIPTFGIIDSNTDPSDIDYPIPANDDSIKTIHLIVNYIADSIVDSLGRTIDTDIPSEELGKDSTGSSDNGNEVSPETIVTPDIDDNETDEKDIDGIEKVESKSQKENLE